MNKLSLAACVLACAVLGSGSAFAGRLSDVRGTVHNLSAASPVSTVKATPQLPAPGVCVFCHTPHVSLSPSTMPLWNKTLSTATYTTYISSSLDTLSDLGIANLAAPDDNSKMCLSCHDGTVAIGAVSRFNKLSNPTIALSGTGAGGIMPASAGDVNAGADTGYTRRLGIDLRNDHPISVNYTSTLATRDGELRAVDSDQKLDIAGIIIGPRGTPGSPKLPLYGPVGSAQVQCPTCHDPHIRDDNTAVVGNQKFLRLNRFQEAQPGNTFSVASDIICLACHDKGGNSWAYSAHANSLVAQNELYPATPGPREFPANLPVWKASCLNCHDTHTVQGARYLLREGTDSAAIPKAGGNPASEETCFQCHSVTSIITNPTLSVPDIKIDYGLGNIRMPLAANPEVHDIGGNFNDSYLPEGGVDCSATNKCGADFVEQRQKLGTAGALANRHAECSDCHNPHRVVKFRDFRGFLASGSLIGAADLAGTHSHAAGHTNIASGVLRGMTGVEPDYAGISSFQEMPTRFDVKKGDPAGNTTVNPVNASPYVTREYQVCLKCHSNYGYADNNVYPYGNRPNLGGSGGTPRPTNGLEQFTNQAKEFQAPVLPVSHKGAPATTSDSGAVSPAYSANNYRSWHPVMDNTGRTPAIRGSLAPNTFLPPWNDNTGVGIGFQTMYCSDCHGSATALGTVVPTGGEDGSAWGPHGSSNNFLLKGAWNQASGGGGAGDNALCFRCHVYDQYANPAPPGGKLKSGFSGLIGAALPADRDTNMHVQHAVVMTGITTGGPMRCTQCHEAVSHGWKNKALLVNLNDLGPETGNVAGTQYIPVAGTSGYSQQPYYMGAWLSIASTGFAKSGEWKKADCDGCH